MNKVIYTTILLFLSFLTVRGQTTERQTYIQVSGLIIDEAYSPVPGVAVISRKLKRGTVSERSGIYSITSTPGDTIFFRALGFKRYHTIIPESFEERQCNVDIILEIDTIQFRKSQYLPWKTYNEFLKDMTKEKPVDPIIENMNDNLASIYVAMANQAGVRVSPEAGYRYAMESEFQCHGNT